MNLGAAFLWNQVLEAKYGTNWLDNSSISVYSLSKWATNLWLIVRGGPKDLCWFMNGLRIKVGDGRLTLFWHEHW
ncbi:hypothetical protein Ancab_005679, partial [Ancistrocladus abbreviatus]